MSAAEVITDPGGEADRYADLPSGLQLCYRAYGQQDGETIVLIAGLGLQLISWPDNFIEAFVRSGYRVIAHDNRDAGLSSKIAAPPPSKLDQILGRAPHNAYAVQDMAEDVVALLDALQVRRAHLVGMSMGGMIAQSVAARHPTRVLSLTSIFSNTGARRIGQPAFSTKLRMSGAAPRDSDEAVVQYVRMMRHIGDPHVPGIEADWATYARRAWVRNGNRANAGGIGRQIGAILKSGDRTSELRHIRARTLVVHGKVDRMVHPSGGRATAGAIPGARLITMEALRHQIDTARAAELADLILPHLAAVPASTRPTVPSHLVR